MVKGTISRVPGRTHRAQFGGAAPLFSTMIEYAFNCLSALGFEQSWRAQRVTSPQRAKLIQLDSKHGSVTRSHVGLFFVKNDSWKKLIQAVPSNIGPVLPQSDAQA